MPVNTHSHISATEEIPKPRRGKYKSYSIMEKKAILEETLTASTCSVALKHNMSESTIRLWRKQDLDAQRHKRSGRLPGGGHPLSYPTELDEDIHAWVLQRRDRNLAVSTHDIQMYAKEVIQPHSPQFKASYGWVQKFMKRNNLTLRAKTSQSQKLPGSYETDVTSFREFIGRNRRRQDPSYIMNMDETPLYFDNVPNRTVEQVGAKSVKVRTTGGEKKRCTVVLGITHTGEFMKTMVIFKGKRKLKLNHPDNIIVRVQEKGWMNEQLMLEWIDLCLRPHTDRRPSMLVLDSFRGHLTSEVSEAMKKTNTIPAVIPGGCTPLLQPLDVSINKPFKDQAKKLWCEYMHTIDSTDKPTKTANNQQVVDWIVRAISSISMEMVVKSFKVTGISNALDGSEDNLINSNIIVNSN